MADRYLLETSSVDGYLLEDASGVLLLEWNQEPDEVPDYLAQCARAGFAAVALSFAFAAGAMALQTADSSGEFVPAPYVDDDPGVSNLPPFPQLSWWATTLYLDTGGFSAPSTIDEAPFIPGVMRVPLPPVQAFTESDEYAPYFGLQEEEYRPVAMRVDPWVAPALFAELDSYAPALTVEELEYLPGAMRIPLPPLLAFQDDSDWVPPPAASVDDDPGYTPGPAPRLSFWATTLHLDTAAAVPSTITEDWYTPPRPWAAARPPIVLVFEDDWVPPPVLTLADDDTGYQPPPPMRDDGIWFLVLGDGSEAFAPATFDVLVANDRSMEVYHLTDMSLPFHDLTDRSGSAYDPEDESRG